MKSDYKQTFVCRFQCFKELSRFCRSVATYIGKPRAKLPKYLKIKYLHFWHNYKKCGKVWKSCGMFL